MEVSICNFLKAVDESNRATEMAMHHAASILNTFSKLSLESRSLMIDALFDLIADEEQNCTQDC